MASPLKRKRDERVPTSASSSSSRASSSSSRRATEIYQDASPLRSTSHVILSSIAQDTLRDQLQLSLNEMNSSASRIEALLRQFSPQRPVLSEIAAPAQAIRSLPLSPAPVASKPRESTHQEARSCATCSRLKQKVMGLEATIAEHDKEKDAWKAFKTWWLQSLDKRERSSEHRKRDKVPSSNATGRSEGERLHAVVDKLDAATKGVWERAGIIPANAKDAVTGVNGAREGRREPSSAAESAGQQSELTLPLHAARPSHPPRPTAQPSSSTVFARYDWPDFEDPSVRARVMSNLADPAVAARIHDIVSAPPKPNTSRSTSSPTRQVQGPNKTTIATPPTSASAGRELPRQGAATNVTSSTSSPSRSIQLATKTTTTTPTTSAPTGRELPRQAAASNVTPSTSTTRLPPPPTSTTTIPPTSAATRLPTPPIPTAATSTSSTSRPRPPATATTSNADEVGHIDSTPIRSKLQRRSMLAHDCPDCEHFYKHFNDLDLQIPGRGDKEKMACSRHRTTFKRAVTPEGYWNIGFPTTQEAEEINQLAKEKRGPTFDGANANAGGQK